ncbi:hypothetical protein D3C78_1008430 [compost metagenome]
MTIEFEQVAVEQLAQQGGAVEQRCVADAHQTVEGPVQGLASGTKTVAITGYVIDHTAAGQAWRQQTEATAQPTLPWRTDNGRNTGQRHVVADVQVTTDTDPGYVFGKAQAVDVNVVGVSKLVRGTLQ